MKLPHYVINRITPPAEGEKGVTLQCSAVNGGLPNRQEILITPSGTEAEIKKVQPFIDDKYLVTIKGCIRTRLKEGGALLPLKSSCFFGHEALFVQSAKELPRGDFIIKPPEELRELYPKGPIEARISGKPGFPLCLVETRFNIPFIPLFPWTIVEGVNRSNTTLWCVDPPPKESLHKGELEMFAGYFKNGISAKNLFLLRLRLNLALFLPQELHKTTFSGYRILKDLIVSDKTLEKVTTLIHKRSSAQGGVKSAELIEASGLPEAMLRVIIDTEIEKGDLKQISGWIVKTGGNPEERLSPTGREVLKKMREKSFAGTRRVLVKDPVLLKTVDELCRMELLFSDGEVILSTDTLLQLTARINEARHETPEATPSELAAALGVQRKVIFSVIKHTEESAG